MSTVTIFRNEPNQLMLAPGDVIFRQGEPGEAMFAVVEGEVEVVRDGHPIAVLTP